MRQRTRPGATLFELLWVLVVLSTTIASAVWGTKRFGWLGGVMGGGLGLLAIPLSLSALWWVDDRLRPRKPRCASGRCRGWRYTNIPPPDAGAVQVPRGLLPWFYRCRCGDTYMACGDRFMRLGSDGAWIPYMMRVVGREWRVDDGEPIIAGKRTFTRL